LIIESGIGDVLSMPVITSGDDPPPGTLGTAVEEGPPPQPLRKITNTNIKVDRRQDIIPPHSFPDLIGKGTITGNLTLHGLPIRLRHYDAQRDKV
jgi:hypothetical protein